MNGLDLIVIAIGLAVGWFAVSALIDKASGAARSRALRPETYDEVPAEVAWQRVLGLREDASVADVEAAYAERIEGLRADSPGIMTQPELESQRRAREFLDAARDAALEAVGRRPAE